MISSNLDPICHRFQDTATCNFQLKNAAKLLQMDTVTIDSL